MVNSELRGTEGRREEGRREGGKEGGREEEDEVEKEIEREVLSPHQKVFDNELREPKQLDEVWIHITELLKQITKTN